MELKFDSKIETVNILFFSEDEVQIKCFRTIDCDSSASSIFSYQQVDLGASVARFVVLI